MSHWVIQTLFISRIILCLDFFSESFPLFLIAINEKELTNEPLLNELFVLKKLWYMWVGPYPTRSLQGSSVRRTSTTHRWPSAFESIFSSFLLKVCFVPSGYRPIPILFGSKASLPLFSLHVRSALFLPFLLSHIRLKVLTKIVSTSSKRIGL